MALKQTRNSPNGMTLPMASYAELFAHRLNAKETSMTARSTITRQATNEYLHPERPASWPSCGYARPHQRETACSRMSSVQAAKRFELDPEHAPAAYAMRWRKQYVFPPSLALNPNRRSSLACSIPSVWLLHSILLGQITPPPRVTSTTLEWHRRVMDVGTPRISCEGGFLPRN